MKHLPGFAPIDFQMVGRTLLVVGVFCILFKGISYITGRINISDSIFHIGMGSVIVVVSQE